MINFSTKPNAKGKQSTGGALADLITTGVKGYGQKLERDINKLEEEDKQEYIKYTTERNILNSDTDYINSSLEDREKRLSELNGKYIFKTDDYKVRANSIKSKDNESIHKEWIKREVGVSIDKISHYASTIYDKDGFNMLNQMMADHNKQYGSNTLDPRTKQEIYQTALQSASQRFTQLHNPEHSNSAYAYQKSGLANLVGLVKDDRISGIYKARYADIYDRDVARVKAKQEAIAKEQAKAKASIVLAQTSNIDIANEMISYSKPKRTAIVNKKSLMIWNDKTLTSGERLKQIADLAIKTNTKPDILTNMLYKLSTFDTNQEHVGKEINANAKIFYEIKSTGYDMPKSVERKYDLYSSAMTLKEELTPEDIKTYKERQSTYYKDTEIKNDIATKIAEIDTRDNMFFKTKGYTNETNLKGLAKEVQKFSIIVGKDNMNEAFELGKKAYDKKLITVESGGVFGNTEKLPLAGEQILSHNTNKIYTMKDDMDILKVKKLLFFKNKYKNEKTGDIKAYEDYQKYDETFVNYNEYVNSTIQLEPLEDDTYRVIIKTDDELVDTVPSIVNKQDLMRYFSRAKDLDANK